MKAIVRIGLWKAIAFLTTVLFLISCNPDEPVVLKFKPVVGVQRVDSITTTSAIIVASVVANEDNAVVSVKYKALSDTVWITYVLPETVSGDKAITVNLPLKGLQPGTKYEYNVMANNVAGLVETTLSQFATEGLTKAIAVIKPVINLKINSVTLVAMITANQPASVVSFEFKPSASTDWQSQSLTTTYSGSDSTQVSYNVDGLQANTNYDYRLKVINKAGETLSNVGTFETYAVSDYDGNLYHTVTIGTQTWLKENFRGTHFANGDEIPNVTDATTWSNLKTGAYCWYDNDSKNGSIYGGLYNFYVEEDKRSLIVGWHTPSGDEWVTLGNYLGGYQYAGLKLMSKEYWLNPLQTPTNSSGFTAVPSGAFALDTATNKFIFMNLGETAVFWTADMFSGECSVLISKTNCFLDIGTLYNPKYGFAIRLMKN
jgi:uncharacterized protein (TIGR02145 family)